MEESCLLFAPKMFLRWFFSSFSGCIVSTLLVKLLIVICWNAWVDFNVSNIFAHVFLLLLFLLLLQYTFLFSAHIHTYSFLRDFFWSHYLVHVILFLFYECIIFSNSPEYNSCSYCVLFSGSLVIGLFLSFFL